MNHRDRFFNTIHYQPVDRPASWLGLPVPSAEPGLIKHFGVKNIDQLRITIDDDIYPIEVPYNYPPSNHIACAFKFSKVDHLDNPDDRTLTAPGFSRIIVTLQMLRNLTGLNRLSFSTTKSHTKGLSAHLPTA